MNKNEFALKVMRTMNSNLLQYEHGSPTIVQKGYYKNGEYKFYDEENEPFTIKQLFIWFNILVNDEEYLESDMITDKMLEVHAEAKELGYITQRTPRYW